MHQNMSHMHEVLWDLITLTLQTALKPLCQTVWCMFTHMPAFPIFWCESCKVPKVFRVYFCHLTPVLATRLIRNLCFNSEGSTMGSHTANVHQVISVIGWICLFPSWREHESGSDDWISLQLSLVSQPVPPPKPRFDISKHSRLRPLLC